MGWKMIEEISESRNNSKGYEIDEFYLIGYRS